MELLAHNFSLHCNLTTKTIVSSSRWAMSVQLSLENRNSRRYRRRLPWSALQWQRLGSFAKQIVAVHVYLNDLICCIVALLATRLVFPILYTVSHQVGEASGIDVEYQGEEIWGWRFGHKIYWGMQSSWPWLYWEWEKTCQSFSTSNQVTILKTRAHVHLDLLHWLRIIFWQKRISSSVQSSRETG